MPIESRALRGLDWLPERMKAANVPGVSVAVIDGSEVAGAQSWGRLAATRDDVVTPESLFQAASMSKPVVAFAALRLVAEGILDLDADVNDYLRSWKVPANGSWQPRVTLRHLMSHTGGLTVHGFPGHRQDETLPTLVEVLDGVAPANTAPVRVDSIPGTRWRYSGGGTTVMQLLMTDVTGRHFTELMNELVLQPALMDTATFEQPLPPALKARAAVGHRSDGPTVDGGWHAYVEAAGGLWCTPTDLCRFALAFQNARNGLAGALLPHALAIEALTEQPPGVPHGLGPALTGSPPVRFGHGGFNLGYKGNFTAACAGGYGCAVMMNSETNAPLRQLVIDAVAAAYGWPDYAPPPPDPLSAVDEQEIIGRYVGSYRTDHGLDLPVISSGGGLSLLVPGQDPLPLDMVSTTEATVTGCRTEVVFRLDERGSAVTLTLHEVGSDVTAQRLGQVS